jgi:hypothetical protein
MVGGSGLDTKPCLKSDTAARVWMPVFLLIARSLRSLWCAVSYLALPKNHQVLPFVPQVIVLRGKRFQVLSRD